MGARRRNIPPAAPPPGPVGYFGLTFPPHNGARGAFHLKKTAAPSWVLVWDEKPKSATLRTWFGENEVRDVARLGAKPQTSTQEGAAVFLNEDSRREPLCGGNVRPKYPRGPPGKPRHNFPSDRTELQFLSVILYA